MLVVLAELLVPELLTELLLLVLTLSRVLTFVLLLVSALLLAAMGVPPVGVLLPARPNGPGLAVGSGLTSLMSQSGTSTVSSLLRWKHAKTASVVRTL